MDNVATTTTSSGESFGYREAAQVVATDLARRLNAEQEQERLARRQAAGGSLLNSRGQFALAC